MRRNFLTSFLQSFLLAIIFLLSSCIAKNVVTVTLKDPAKKSSSTSSSPTVPTSTAVLNASVSSVQIINNQLVIHGTGLTDVTNVKVDGNSLAENFAIESITATQIIANSIHAISFDVAKVFNLILSDANASATFAIDFSLCNSTLNGHGFDCTITANDKEVLSFDSVSGKWKPRAINGLSYKGTWDATGTAPASITAGDYYIVSVAGAGYAIGDWAVCRGGAVYDKIANSNTITNVFGRTGVIAATKGDYTITKLADVDTTTTPPILGDVLKFDGTNWVPGVVSAGSGGTVTSVSATAPLAVANGTSTPALTIAQANTTTNGYLSSVDWNTFNNKQASITAGTTAQYYRGDKTFQTLDTLAVAENTNLYFTNARVLGVPLTGFAVGANSTILSTDNILSAFAKTQGQIDSLTAGASGYVATAGGSTLAGTTTLSGVIDATATGSILVGAPSGATSAISKSYADSADALKLNKAGDTMSGLLIVDANLKIKGGGVGYVTLKGHPTSVDYNFVFPVNAGTGGYVLQTDGAGNTSWVDPSTTSAGVGTVNSGSIVDGSIMNVDINASAAIDYSKLNVPAAAIPITALNATGTKDATTYLKGNST